MQVWYDSRVASKLAWIPPLLTEISNVVSSKPSHRVLWKKQVVICNIQLIINIMLNLLIYWPLHDIML